MKTRDGIVGLSTDRERPSLGQGAARPREFDQVSIHGSHQGLRPQPHQQAGHMPQGHRSTMRKNPLPAGGHPHMTPKRSSGLA